MKIDASTLENVVLKSSGEFTARCPACGKEGHDKDHDHLIVYPNGAFACVKYPGDKEHNKKILSCVGMKAEQAIPKLTVRRLMIPRSSVIMELGRLGRPIPTPCDKAEDMDVLPKKLDCVIPSSKKVNQEVGAGV